MTTPRLFVTAPLLEGVSVPATPGQAHYLGTVMRRGVGDPVLLFNGAEGEWQARIASLRRDRAEFAVEHRLRPQEPEPDLWQLFALLKRDATDLVLRAATERAVAAKAETLIRRAHSRGAAIGVAVTGSDGQAVRRLELYLADVVSDVERS